MTTKGKGWHEDFARFFEEPSREGLRKLLQFPVGERNCLDFKREWPPFPKLARHILGMANYGGGCLVVGVAEREDKTFDSVGLRSLIDHADIQQGIERFIPSQLKHETVDFSYQDAEYPAIKGKSFQVMFIEDSPEYVPFVAKAGGTAIRANAIYVRRGTASVAANYEELQQILNRRIATEYSSQREFDLEMHLAELKTLYTQLERYYVSPPFGESFRLLLQAVTGSKTPNPKYPKEDFEDFVLRLIEVKKTVIEGMLRQ